MIEKNPNGSRKKTVQANTRVSVRSLHKDLVTCDLCNTAALHAYSANNCAI